MRFFFIKDRYGLMKILAVVLTMLIFSNINLFSADDDNKTRARFGAWYHYGINYHIISEIKLPSISNCCDSLNEGFGNGNYMGILLELPLNNDILFGIRTGFYSKEGNFKETYKKSETIFGVDTVLSINQELNATVANISFEPYFVARIIDNLFLSFGYRFGYFIERNYNYMYESRPLISGLIGQNTKSSDIFNYLREYDATLNFGLNYDIPLNRTGTFILTPEIIYETAIMNIYEEGKWKINTLRGGLSIKISPESSNRMIREIYLYDTLIVYREDISTEYLKPGHSIVREYETKENKTTFHVSEILRIDTLFKPSYLRSTTDLFTDLSVYGKMAWGDVRTVNSVLAKVQMTKEIYPILPYIFFDKGSSTLPVKYKDNYFDLNTYYPNPVKYHHNVLNIIADRMLKYPYSKIVLTGFIDEMTEGSDCSLANNRAEAVKEYLVRNCNIPQERIEINRNEFRCYPITMTRALTDERFAENRIVEIRSSNTKILEPIVGDWYQKPMVLTPDILYFDVSGSSLNKIKNWNFRLTQDKLVLKDIKSDSKEYIFEHAITEEEAYYLDANKPLTADYTAYNSIGEYSTAQKKLKVFIDTIDTEVESLNLALFGVSESKLSENIENQIQSFISHLDKNDKLFIYGYTDELGGEDFNHELAKSRAYQIAMYITKLNPTVKIDVVEAVGTRRFAPGISSYSTPEERFLSRIVEIQIRRKRR